MQKLKDLMQDMIRLYMEETSISEQMKSIKQEVKELGYNPSQFSAIAKNMANGELSELKEKTHEMLNLISIVTGEQ